MPPADNLAVSLTFGVLLVLAGITLVEWHRRDRSRKLRDPLISELEQRHVRRQFSRRLQVAVLLILMGILIPAGDAWLTVHRNPRQFAIYVAMILVLSLWMFVLAAIDWLASHAWNRRLRNSLRQLERKRHELESQARRLRQGQ